MEKQHENKTQKVERFSPLGLQERVSLVAQIVKNPPAMQETQVRSLGQNDPLEEGMATPSVVATCSGKQTHSEGQCR